MVEPNNTFDDIERELRQQLAPRSAPPGLAQKVLASIDQHRRTAPSRMPAWRWITAAAVLAATAVLAGGHWERQREQQIAGRRARAQVMLALHITGATLQQIQLKVQRTGKETE